MVEIVAESDLDSDVGLAFLKAVNMKSMKDGRT